MTKPNRPNFVVKSTINLELVSSVASDAEIKELPLADASLLAPHIEGHPDSLWVAYSGVQLAGTHGIFDHNHKQVALEWVRHETNPESGEPNTNIYRYIFGWTSDGRAIGLDVTKKPSKGQVADHWEDFDDVLTKHFPNFLNLNTASRKPSNP